MLYAKWWLPILLMALITPFTPVIDLMTANYFYHSDTHQFVSNDIVYYFYTYGQLPAIFLALVAAMIFLFSYAISSWKQWRSPALVCLLTVILGAGVIVNAVLKDHWGRPRPKQVIEFGGIQQFRPYYSPNFFHQPEPSKSFPCGHCSMGFAFFALAIIGQRLHDKRVFWTGIILAITLGIALSITRIVQGGHFVSDTLMSALVMWFTALTCDWLIYDRKST